MTFKRFGAKDVVLNTIVTKPEVSFLVHSSSVYYQYERPELGDFSNNVKHVPSGHLSLFEYNINRPSGSLIYPFIEKSSTRYAWKTITTAQFDNFQFLYGDTLTGSYPDKASISRIYVPAGQEFSSSVGAQHANKKYVSALKNPINFQSRLSTDGSYGSMGTDEVNLICCPGIFYGSKMERGSIELDYYLTGTLMAKATDKYADGRLIQVSGATAYNGQQVGTVVYSQGIMALSASWDLHSTETDYYLSTSSATSPKWTNFGTGIAQVGEQVEHGSVVSSSYLVKFKGINKIPTLTMYSYAKMSELNHSNNPTFTETTSSVEPEIDSRSYFGNKEMIKKTNKSIHADFEDDFENTTYISKVGIYDKYKNLIAIATLANPIKKTEKRDYMIKMRLDF